MFVFVLHSQFVGNSQRIQRKTGIKVTNKRSYSREPDLSVKTKIN